MLKKLVLNSKSNDVLNEISSKMAGKTFHHHYHMLYDIRTFLGEEKKFILKLEHTAVVHYL